MLAEVLLDLVTNVRMKSDSCHIFFSTFICPLETRDGAHFFLCGARLEQALFPVKLSLNQLNRFCSKCEIIKIFELLRSE